MKLRINMSSSQEKNKDFEAKTTEKQGQYMTESECQLLK